MAWSIRLATADDKPALQALIAASSRGLARGDYTDQQIEAALGGAWGVDSELIADGTYFVVEADDGRIAACGGWSHRATLFGSDRQAGRHSALLDPQRDPARIRAFFVDPAFARQGIGRALLQRCEDAARAQGFGRAELMATLPGRRLYLACGYEGETPVPIPLGDGLTIDFVPMGKVL